MHVPRCFFRRFFFPGDWSVQACTGCFLLGSTTVCIFVLTRLQVQKNISIQELNVCFTPQNIFQIFFVSIDPLHLAWMSFHFKWQIWTMHQTLKLTRARNHLVDPRSSFRKMCGLTEIFMVLHRRRNLMFHCFVYWEKLNLHLLSFYLFQCTRAFPLWDHSLKQPIKERPSIWLIISVS